ncbi:family 5 putative glycoside hydrolase family 13/Glycosyltransferase [Chaetomidium leptoderma]|uniref:alpha-1,3-glucan synthase n=1 Tax=Chaetomidium leptoderma TaxID=669021 RepID=A0AAN6VPZ0_9PEZI|nr:family 5 putative glycoside hydrolase family 13/Glycosyltransferase [Chaetomidium leptoderma]
MAFSLPLFLLVTLFAASTHSLPYLPEYEAYNLNQNKAAKTPLEYWGEWPDHQFHPSPENWRMPFYSLFLDRFVNGEPSNDNSNGTAFEVDMLSTQLRVGGDISGLVDTLDYLQGMGIKALYISGSPFINQPWSADSFSPLDLTLLDPHFGNIAEWRNAIDEIHRRGMYVVLENTMSTMGDLIGFEGYLNTTTPFSFTEHNAVWKSSRRYWDFPLGDDSVACEYPRFWDEHGKLEGEDVMSHMTTCRTSDFDQYGDVESFGRYPEWQKQLSKFGFVQDRLREWRPSVLDKIKLFSCMTIASLDIDGFRIDKALTITVDAQAEWSEHMRSCARRFNKTNFFIPGEIVGGNALGALYFGRGKEPGMAVKTLEESYNATNATDPSSYVRTNQALDSACFHYSAYRSLTRFLAVDGVYGAEMDTRINWAEAWQDMLLTTDFVNANTGKFDPRHMFGVSNQDVFRWPSIQNGTHKYLVGAFIMSLLFPGIPIVNWGEEQAFYVLENIAGNYLYGRQPMVSTVSWERHGCYRVGSEKYPDFPLDAALYGCDDPNVSLDHRDPSHPVRAIVKRLLELRATYPVLNDGFDMYQLSNHTHWIYQPGSNGTGTELGLWSYVRMSHQGHQNLSSIAHGDDLVWLLLGNENQTTTYRFNCSDSETALLSSFGSGATVKNLLYPYDEYELEASARNIEGDDPELVHGCISELQFPAWGFKAFVPKGSWVGPAPIITKFLPGHDYRLESASSGDTSVDIQIQFSREMDCESVFNAVELTSNTVGTRTASLNRASLRCRNLDIPETPPQLVGQEPSRWEFAVTINSIPDGIHRITVRNATGKARTNSTGSVDHFLLRVGNLDNPVVFPRHANYSTDLVYAQDNDIYVRHRATGATRFRCSQTWASSWTEWHNYTGEDFKLPANNWTGTNLQAWEGEHVVCQYFSKLAGSSHHQQEGDLDASALPRRFPHLFVNGHFNAFGFDAGIPNQMKQQSGTGTWSIGVMAEWPTAVQFNVWGLNPDGLPDQTWIFGDVNFDYVLDRLPPGSLRQNVVNITEPPPAPFVGWRFEVDDATMKYSKFPVGSRDRQIAIFSLMWVLPLLGGWIVVFIFTGSFYKVKHNISGAAKNGGISEKFRRVFEMKEKKPLARPSRPASGSSSFGTPTRPGTSQSTARGMHGAGFGMEIGAPRKKVLIATMEYDIEDWRIKIKIGGLGVMAQLMGKALGHLDIIWVVPCVGGLENHNPNGYPVDQPADPMEITILGSQYNVDVQYHQLRNMTYVLLDAPVFRLQTSSKPYPDRMDDLDSAIYYSAWNQCIAETLKRFNPDVYHINDFHGALAPLYLLPRVIPCCLSLHNAEFQGMWSLGTKEEKQEVCNVFNLDQKVVERFVQFGEVFNLLHAGASYLREFQHGFGAVGVSKKYGKRSFARYPIFWGLSKIGSLPNPDPSDTAEWSPELEAAAQAQGVEVDAAFEAGRADLRRQAQEWAGIDQDPDAELFVFVGRWSMQKGVDLIADVFPSVLEHNPKVQLIAVGPVIDLYGRLAAIKLERLMEQYPSRVYSKPEFTQLPPYIFSGAEFALIPSRDEPFGLVAVEFGRKGALGVGARVGGLGNMPGWYYTVESTSAKHLISQFKVAIQGALSSDTETRAKMRAVSGKQRFPVARWVEEINDLHKTSIHKSQKYKDKPDPLRLVSRPRTNLSRPPSPEMHDLEPTIPSSFLTPGHASIPSSARSPSSDFGAWPLPRSITPHQHRLSGISITSVTKGRKDFALQKVDPFFTDADGEYTDEFKRMLTQLDTKTSETDLCIEQYLVRSEKQWFEGYKSAKFGLSPSRNASRVSLVESPPSALNSSRFLDVPSQPASPSAPSIISSVDSEEDADEHSNDAAGSRRIVSAFETEDTCTTNPSQASAMQRFMLRKVLDWPVYTLVLAFGQILAANSYQISLLNGEQGQTAGTLYTIASIYGTTSVLWWIAFRRLKSVWVLSTPFAVYGAAFLFAGCAPFASSIPTRGWLQSVGSGFYAAAASSGSMFFALNFGDEGGAPVRTWVIRACAVQGVQQIYISGLWYWGSQLSSYDSNGIPVAQASNTLISAVCFPVAVLLMALSVATYFGLPEYYRQTPGSIPSFFKSIFRRKLIICFLISVLIQNYWLSSVYGRSWGFLWTSSHASTWQILLLVVLFFGVIWILLFAQLAHLSREHSWLFPVLAIGLGAPRWAQILWGVSGMGTSLPWGSAVAGALVSRALWLWLGVLDALQGTGVGMMLLQTTTRFHNNFALVAAQVLGSVATAVGRATAPDAVGPGPVFPNLALGLEGLGNAWFWVCLLMQLGICVMLGTFFRKEQLSKP